MTGFSGFAPGRREIIGHSGLPHATQISEYYPKTEGYDAEDDDEGPVRKQFDDLDIEDTYEIAIKALTARKQTQEALIAIVSAKMSEKTTSYAQQHIHLHNFFAFFDKSNSGFMNQAELRSCLESANIQFNDDQFIALFAYFDRGFCGKIEWKRFIDRIIIPNPKGGLAILPKQITSNK